MTDSCSAGFMVGNALTDISISARNTQTVYTGGWCVGFVTGIALVNPGSCLPAGSTIDQILRVVVTANEMGRLP
jgi:hypothetical protein